ncbi:IS5 family transposase [Xanthomonas campestris pv. campestris]|uniref:IS1479 transposase n=21 Tax=Xanthomonas campestris TaxID=339 RepID=Q8NL46_XANCP|nr:IS5-like element IS1646 family transposase [Xanthomonas campestris]AAM39446.1 IS1479 transposase [Xanthomonas campestris pv. campestris str. ATCC 33913]AAM40903.1 IS1479 transposase [Xanthomonas campestris pv. campestris str. ATCC 33913]AAM42573.1 IS1479 transposase [Xanthomonas campestris pv. campestris str. ATCC 33913]AAM42855.1 IS1479 transposase [Xanthomonas campestris pv. campestris str. ATCC 33913]AAY47224.1 IS1479 transposase [Xanthomonas campestris pv. campestris str. 8004]
MQLTFGDAEGLGKRKQTRREIFLAEMEQVVPWQQLLGLVAPHYPVSGRPGRQPYALATMLRIHLLQQWYALSDPAMEEALHEIPTLRRFAQLGGLDNVPDETTILNFRRLLETHGLAARMLEAVNAHLARKGQSLRSGTIVDATLIAAPSSTKNADHARDPEMHQTKKGNQWYFGMKAHIGVDEFSGLVHHVHCTAANVADVTVTHALLHGKEDSVFGDSGYTGADKREELQDCEAAFFIAAKRSVLQAIGNKRERAREQRWEHFKASVRAKVEHPFRVIKRQFGYTKVRYRGLAKNTAQVLTLFALSNLWMKRKQLLPAMGSVRL